MATTSTARSPSAPREFRLPRRTGVASYPSDAEDPRLHVLVADDDPGVRAALRACLEYKGFRVSTASNGRDAVEQYGQRRQRIDLVLLDVQMPFLDGPRTLLALRALSPALKACFMSADPTPYTRRALMELGAADVFVKPFNALQLATVLHGIAGADAAVARH